MDTPSFEQLINPKRAAVVVIDVQNDFCSPEFPAYGAMLPRLERLLAEARRARVRMVFTQTVHSEKSDSAVWVSRFATRPHRRATCILGSPGADFHPSIQPRPEDVVVVKHRYNAFLGTDLELILRAQGIDSLLFTGIATNVCVENTAREAFQRDFWTIMVADCMAAHSDEAHKAALANAERGFGLVVTSERVAKAWQGAFVPA